MTEHCFLRVLHLEFTMKIGKGSEAPEMQYVLMKMPGRDRWNGMSLRNS